MLTRSHELERNEEQLVTNETEAPIEGDQPERRLRPFIAVAVVMGIVQAILMVYAVLRAFSWDEGFHLLAAQLIEKGQKPYLDFCFPQPPLNAYWNAFWMHLFGDNWRVPHIVAALLTGAAILMAADYILTRFP